MSFWENVIDTVLNIGVFVFIGILLWLYLKEAPESDTPKKNPKKKKKKKRQRR